MSALPTPADPNEAERRAIAAEILVWQGVANAPGKAAKGRRIAIDQIAYLQAKLASLA